jgi:hypothetical protein
MPAEAFIQRRVRPETKTLVHALAERVQITESALVKEMLQVVLRIAALQGVPKTLNQDVRALVPGRHEVTAMLKVAEGLRDHFKESLKANERSWLQGYAETSH